MQVVQYSWPLAAWGAGAAALFVAVLLVLTKDLHGRLSMDSSFGVQRFHTQPTPRIGGIAIVSGVLLGALLLRGEARVMLQVVVLAGAPAFAFGLLEDLTKRVSVAKRLFATLGSGLLGWFITGISITYVNVPVLDALLVWTPVAVLFTAVAVSGVANAVNIIDGFNGLAAGVALIVLSAIGLLSVRLGDVQLGHVCLNLAASVAGFLLVNWPLGKLFLGDGGAYFVGFAIAWSAVLLLQRHAQVSAWCPLLICAYPVVEVLFSMLRRKQHRSLVGQPDRLHLHSLVKRRVVRRLFPQTTNLMRNSITGALLGPLLSVPFALWALAFYDDTPALVLGMIVFVLAYKLSYCRLTRFHWLGPRSGRRAGEGAAAATGFGHVE